MNRKDADVRRLPGSVIRRYTIWGNKHAADECLRNVADRANVACSGARYTSSRWATSATASGNGHSNCSTRTSWARHSSVSSWKVRM